MESEPARPIAPREHLQAFDEGARAGAHEAHVSTPLWAWPTIALLAPAAVALQRLEGVTRVAAITALVIPVIIAMVVVFRLERSARAKPKRQRALGYGFGWRFLSLFCMIMGLQMTGLLAWSSGVRVAALTYLFIAVGSTFSTYKFDQYMDRITATPGQA